MQLISQSTVHKQISAFCQTVFINHVKADVEQAEAVVHIKTEEWLLNKHFSGTSIIQSFFQLGMVLYYQNEPRFDSDTKLFFLGGLKIKYFAPILLRDRVTFSLKTIRFVRSVLLFEGTCLRENGRKVATINNCSITSKPRTVILQGDVT